MKDKALIEQSSWYIVTIVTIVTKTDCGNGWLLLMALENIQRENDKLITLMPMFPEHRWENKSLYTSFE